MSEDEARRSVVAQWLTRADRALAAARREFGTVLSPSTRPAYNQAECRLDSSSHKAALETDMTIPVSPENERFIQEAISSGTYADPATVLDEALRLLRRREELRRSINAGLDQLDQGMGIDGEQVFAELQKRLDEKRS